MYVVHGHFDCEAMHHYLFKNLFLLEDLPCHQIMHELIDDDVITHDQKRLMNHQIDKLGHTVFHNILPDLYHEKPKKFKVFLYLMEQSDVPLLVDAAQQLGE